MNLDTRNLLADRQGIYIRKSAVSRGNSICDFCVMRDNGCRLARQGERCEQFVPALTFVSADGLDGSFSTFRPSAIWYDRARVISNGHKRVALTKVDGDLIGFAKLVSAHRAPFSQLMAEHAWSNHLVRSQGLSKQEAARFLTGWIGRHMGSRYVKRSHALCTVIYCERIKEAAAA